MSFRELGALRFRLEGWEFVSLFQGFWQSEHTADGDFQSNRSFKEQGYATDRESKNTHKGSPFVRSKQTGRMRHA